LIISLDTQLYALLDDGFAMLGAEEANKQALKPSRIFSDLSAGGRGFRTS
jgi:hypothetical protein